MVKASVKYHVIDAFTDTAFKGNPAAVCLLGKGNDVDEAWMQSVATEFNLSETAFLTPVGGPDLPNPTFNLRWFTPVAEVELCGHATLAAAHFLFTSDVRSDLIEFRTKSGNLTSRRVAGLKKLRDPSTHSNTETDEKFAIELDFPVIPLVECDSSEIPSLHETLKGASIVGVKKTLFGDLIVELASGKDVVDIKPQFDEIKQCAGRGVIVTGPATDTDGSRYDFFSRFFCPKLGVKEDPVCGSAHCALAPYWRKKLGKSNFTAYMASPRGGRLDVLLDEEKGRVQIQGEAVTVMVGSLLA